MGRREPYFRVESEGVCIRTVPGFLPKTATLSHLGQDMLPSFKAVNKLVCVKRCVKLYLEATDPLVATTENHLFVCYGGKEEREASIKKDYSFLDSKDYKSGICSRRTRCTWNQRTFYKRNGHIIGRLQWSYI